MEKYLGLVFSNGQQWNNIRRFTLRHLRDLGMGKSKMVSAIQYEATELIMEFDDLIIKIQDSLSMLMLIDFFPWLKTILPEPVLHYLTNRKLQVNSANVLKKIIQDRIDEHVETLDVNNPRDFFDDYLIEMEKQKSNPESTMSIRDLIGTTADLFGAGYVTTATAINFSIFYMCKFPHVQKRLRKEVDEVLGNNQAILDDKAKLPYTEAFITESLRFANQTQFSIPRTVTNDTKLGGYTIPKDSIILPTVEEMHSDSKYFDSPKEFRPERFLNDDGKFEPPKIGFLPFGTGRRQCIGESLSRMELLIFLTTLVQHLEFSVPKGETLDITARDFVFFNAPRLEQNILITERS
ncbi:Cytochrome P450 2C42 [Armadillidium nasatum]|uniref:Cytochrome P450 2C42 n=1 Tax=Armadillidium nasatum TaxID=96803 RepID=A0A5N5TN27_9CRUS|nr:Cytochrome P450 2C42 [Armadillidium nasatum]